ncbi:porin [Flavobacteriaceae bacterium]|nr:porin [Flavobacteriaceae bacterium]MDA9244943.1 porin [Flavobacteriaceae bacterium]MDA9984275.1 porin [Flavobacteriaceae bacterium]MDB4118078.1 porin [Flavobacteriaceae bacterium]MDB4186669.1 porin [Flavobacteriaceae bacterium]
MRIFKTTFLTLALLAGSLTYAQEETTTEETTEESSFAISGSIDTYFRSSEYAPGTSFGNLPGFALGMANVVVSYEGEKSGFVADLVFGPRGNDAVFGSATFINEDGELVAKGSNAIVNQLYAYYNISDSFTLTLGNFNTFLGYEVISPVANFNYTTSYMFSYGPFSHTGIKADIAVSDNVSIMLGVLNSTDMTEFQPLGEDYMIGAQLGLYGQYINYLGGGTAGVSQIDFTGGFNLTEDFYFGINATSYSDDFDTEFSGIALYPQYTISDSFALGARFEAFSEEGLGAIGSISGEGDNTSFTLTGSYTSGNFIFKPEFRIDSASGEFYSNADGATDSLSTLIVAAIYSF